MKLRLFVLLVSVLMLAAVLAAPLSSKDESAPDFTLKDIDSKDVKLSDVMKDHNLVLIDFWNIQCKPCCEFMNFFDGFNDDFGDKGFTILSINTDTSQSSNKVKPFILGRDYKFHVLLDPNMEVYKRFLIKGVPTTILVNKDLEIVYRHLGYKKGFEDEVRQAISDNLPND